MIRQLTALALALAFASTAGHAGNLDINAFVTNGPIEIPIQTGKTLVTVGSTFSGANFHLVNADGVAQAQAFGVGIDLIAFGLASPNTNYVASISLELFDSFGKSVFAGTLPDQQIIASVSSGSGFFEVDSIPFS